LFYQIFFLFTNGMQETYDVTILYDRSNYSGALVTVYTRTTFISILLAPVKNTHIEKVLYRLNHIYSCDTEK